MAGPRAGPAGATRPMTSPPPSSTPTSTARRCTARRAGLVLHPAGGGRQRDDPQRHQPRHARPHHPPRPAGAVAGRLDGVIAATGVDEIVRWAHAGHLDAPHRGRDTVLGGQPNRRGRQGDHVLQLGQPRRGRLRRPLPFRRAARPQPARRVRRRRAALLPGRPPGPPGDRRHVPRALRPAARHRDHRRARPAAVAPSSTASSISTAASRPTAPRRADAARGRRRRQVFL